jgi:putative membrane protein
MITIAALPLLTHADGWDHSWWPVWPIFWVALIGLLAWLIVRRSHRRHDPFDRAREVLAERYARGELTGEEYRTRLDDLRRDTR